MTTVLRQELPFDEPILLALTFQSGPDYHAWSTKNCDKCIHRDACDLANALFRAMTSKDKGMPMDQAEQMGWKKSRGMPGACKNRALLVNKWVNPNRNMRVFKKNEKYVPW